MLRSRHPFGGAGEKTGEGRGRGGMKQEANLNAAVIECRGVGKTYTLSSETAGTFKEMILRGGRGKRSTAAFEALRDIDLTVRRGEIVGVIGDNGSGKSTLLKLIAGITAPTRGELRVHGTVSSLLEVGVGFHPETTGRENVYLSGSLLGIPPEDLTRRMPDIIAFSELEEFIDSPVKHYSSGMYLRLGFAIGIHVQPDILLIETPQLREWAIKKAEFAGLLDGFAKKAQVGDIEVWARIGAR
ncbi:MAG TPA: ATP-binding cassette domain-containing protein [bacterium]|nr:ATP-binding cassette domain-containing protein [bacterium]